MHLCVPQNFEVMLPLEMNLCKVNKPKQTANKCLLMLTLVFVTQRPILKWRHMEYQPKQMHSNISPFQFLFQS